MNNFFINVDDDFSKICILKIFRPQLEEPEHPPINMMNKKSVVVNVPHKLKSYVLKSHYLLQLKLQKMMQFLMIVNNQLRNAFLTKALQ